jgi:hypothetical protein
MPNAFSEFLDNALREREWINGDFVRESKTRTENRISPYTGKPLNPITHSQLSKLRRDSRDRLGQMPEPDTILAIAITLQVPENTVRTAACRALDGYAIGAANLSQATNQELFAEVQRRFDVLSGVWAERREMTNNSHGASEV